MKDSKATYICYDFYRRSMEMFHVKHFFPVNFEKSVKSDDPVVIGEEKAKQLKRP